MQTSLREVYFYNIILNEFIIICFIYFDIIYKKRYV